MVLKIDFFPLFRTSVFLCLKGMQQFKMTATIILGHKMAQDCMA